jgi:uncharacterized membrane protein YeaQ/YmgE (transglycosylase-associated protein family)
MTRAALQLRGAIVAAATLLGCAWLAAKGPVKVVVGRTEIDEFAPTWYMVSAFPVLGMLAADVIERARRHGILARETLGLGGAVALVVALANLRLGVRWPVSGHVLLLAFFLVLRATFRAKPDGRPRAEAVASTVEFVLATSILVAVSVIKLIHWHDTLTWSVGLAAGGALALAVARFAPANPPTTS